MRRNHKSHVGSPCKSIFDFLSRFGRDFLYKCHKNWPSWKIWREIAVKTQQGSRGGVQGGVPRFHGFSPGSSRFPIWRQSRQRGFFCGGRGRSGECLIGVRGSVLIVSKRSHHLKEFRFISTEKVCFYATGSFLRWRHISTAEVYFYSGGTFLWWRHIFTAEAYFYGGGIFLRWRHISTAEVYFYSGDTFLWWRHIFTAEAYFYGGGIFLRRRHISAAEVYLYEESVFVWKRSILKEIGLSLVWKRGTTARHRWVFM